MPLNGLCPIDCDQDPIGRPRNCAGCDAGRGHQADNCAHEYTMAHG